MGLFKKLKSNLKETSQQHGSNDSLPHIEFDGFIVNDGCCTGDCNQGRQCPQREAKKFTVKSKYLYLFVVFTLGVVIGEQLMIKTIINDCRILNATRFGEIYVKCSTAQKL